LSRRVIFLLLLVVVIIRIPSSAHESPKKSTQPRTNTTRPSRVDKSASRRHGDGGCCVVVAVSKIGSKSFASGAIVVVKVLGALAMIDDGEVAHLSFLRWIVPSFFPWYDMI
jgi:hypothetical protein